LNIENFGDNRVFLQNTGSPGVTAGHNLIENCYIGVSADGTAGARNAGDGINIETTDNTISANVISGNSGNGIHATGTAVRTTIEANYIGTNASGTAAIANGSLAMTGGIRIDATGTTVEYNAISGNTNDGVLITAGSNTLVYNDIGTNPNGTAAVANTENGVNITSGGANTVNDNWISGNTLDGVRIASSANTVNLNYIGTNTAGTAAIANGSNGVELVAGATNNTIGAAGAGNLIAGNGQNGVVITGVTTTGNVVDDNDIGVTAAGTAKLANANDGVLISSQAFANTIGGDGATQGNVISGNSGNGIEINSGTRNVVRNNYIGADSTGLAKLGNADSGVLLANGANNNTIGSLTSHNLIVGNCSGDVLTAGIMLRDSGTNNNLIIGNYIGLAMNGTTAVALGNSRSGILLFTGANSNTIGGTAQGAGNTISNNGVDGIDIESSSNVVSGNYIGLDATGEYVAGLGNGADGIYIGVIQGTGGSNTIGGTVEAARNYVAANWGWGLEISASSTNNYIDYDTFGRDIDGEGAADGNGEISASYGANTFGRHISQGIGG
jgi:titin